MNNRGILRKIDNLGRIVIPKGLRKSLNMQNGDLVEITCNKNAIVIKRFETMCSACGSTSDVEKIGNTYICKECIESIKKMD